MNKYHSRRRKAAAAWVAGLILAVLFEVPLSADPATAGTADAPNPGLDSPSALSDFEHLLEQRDFGTFKIYMRLPAERRDDVFRAYSQGTSMEQIKAVVLNAFIGSH